MSDTEQDAWNKGFNAGCDQDPLDANPYDADTHEREAWDEGWCYGEDPNRL